MCRLQFERGRGSSLGGFGDTLGPDGGASLVADFEVQDFLFGKPEGIAGGRILGDEMGGAILDIQDSDR